VVRVEDRVGDVVKVLQEWRADGTADVEGDVAGVIGVKEESVGDGAGEDNPP